ncbi:MAG: hypothetical protein KC586_30170 [Myxococcales bacterium]|nr:hypothetical protein [Myxococcales bacterium]
MLGGLLLLSAACATSDPPPPAFEDILANAIVLDDGRLVIDEDVLVPDR